MTCVPCVRMPTASVHFSGERVTVKLVGALGGVGSVFLTTTFAPAGLRLLQFAIFVL